MALTSSEHIRGLVASYKLSIIAQKHYKEEYGRTMPH